MPGALGSKGYRPDKDTMSKMFSGLTEGSMGSDYFQPQYTYKGKPISESEYNQRKNMNIDSGNLGITTSQYQQNRPQFSFQPGESGYNATQKGGTYTPFGSGQDGFGAKSYNPYQYKSTTDYSKGLENSAYEGMKSALSQGMSSMNQGMGSRGLARGGMTNEQGGNLALTAGQGLVDQLRGIKQQAQQADFQREQAQAGENQFGAQFGEGQRQYNLGFGEGQRRFGAEFGERQADRGLRELLGQYEMDKGVRGEKYGYWKDPYEDYMKMYLGSLQSAGKDQKGWFPGLGDMMF